jgi:hypothetical protein
MTTSARELKIQTEVGARVRVALAKRFGDVEPYPRAGLFTRNAADGADAARMAKIDALVASGRFTDADRNGLWALSPSALDALFSSKPKKAKSDDELITIDMTDDETDAGHDDDSVHPRAMSAVEVLDANDFTPTTVHDIMCEQGRITPKQRDERNELVRENARRAHKHAKNGPLIPRMHGPAVVDESLADLLPKSHSDLFKARK